MLFSWIIHLISLILISNGAFSTQVIEKVIDKLYYKNISPKDLYWIDTVPGACNLNSQFLDDYLVVDYKFTSQSQFDFFEILMNYDKNTRSFACKNPIGISIKLKLSENQRNNDLLRFLLIEDLDMNGAFDGDDAMYAYTFPLSNLDSNWFELLMPYEKLDFWYTNTQLPNRKLNLEKIRAWRIMVFNENVGQQQNKIHFKELKISCVAEPLIPVEQKQLIRGTFIQLWNNAGCACGEWSLSQWIGEIGRMNKIGINRLIVQYSVYDTHSWYQNNPFGMSTLEKIIVAAEFYGNFKIVFGLYFDENWNWNSKYDPDVYNNLLNKHKTVINELYQMFGNKYTFGGFYIPQEWNNVEWKNDNSIQLLAQWTRDIIVYAKAKTNAPIIISPFFRNSVSKENTALLYDRYLSVLTNSNTGPYIDEIYIQDSYGVEESLQNSFFDIYTYFEALKPVFEKYKTKFGATVEIFNQTTTNGVFAALPAKIDRVDKQINLINYITNNLIQFEWGYMMANNYELYYDYLSTYFE